MNAHITCRVTADLRDQMALDDAADDLGQRIEARAREIVEEVQNYRKGYTFGDFIFEQITETDLAKQNKQLRDMLEMFEQYGYLLFDRQEPGITDDRDVTARAYLIKQIEEWAEKRATQEMEEA